MSSIIPGGLRRALQEAVEAITQLVAAELRAQMPVVGGAALLLLGGTRRTNDVDFAVTTASLASFEASAATDARFVKGSVADWTYVCRGAGIEDLNVPIEFLLMGGGFVPVIRHVVPLVHGFRAAVGELARMKANAWAARESDQDLHDFAFLLACMDASGEAFADVALDADDNEDMTLTAEACGGSVPGLLRKWLGRAGHQV